MRLPAGRDFRLIWTAGIVSQLGDWSARLALALLVLERGGTALMVGVVGMLFLAPWLGIGQALTAFSTRFGRRIVLITCDSFRGIAFIVIGTWNPPTIPLLVLVGLAALADPVFEATKSAFVTEIVPKGHYSEAIQITQVANQSSSLAGYALGGVIVGLVGAEATLNLNGFTFLISALLLILVSQPGVQEAPSRVGASISAGLGFLRTDRISAIGFYATVMSVAAAMSVESQAAVYGKFVAAFNDQTIGLLSAITPAATLVAVTLMRTSGDDTTLLRRGLILGGIAAAGSSALLFAGVGGVLAFLAFALVGVVFSFTTMTNVVVGRRLPDENRVAIFSILQTGVFLGLSLGSLAGGLISDATSPEVAAGAALAVAAVGLLAGIAQVRPE
ncbi:MAG: MFS transporter [Actinomycetia bacterium]|nr:MFS transporter [Actinomycetes bacterium]MCP3911411.1 MFS transporter [Actinomycetes bacterium]